MKTAIIVLAIWSVVSLPFGIFIGRFIAAGQRKPMPKPPKRDKV